MAQWIRARAWPGRRNGQLLSRAKDADSEIGLTSSAPPYEICPSHPAKGGLHAAGSENGLTHVCPWEYRILWVKRLLQYEGQESQWQSLIWISPLHLFAILMI